MHMIRTTLIAAALTLCAASTFAYSGVMTQSGNTIYDDNGNYYTQNGNTIYGSDGTTYTRSGSTIYAEDGTTYTQSGNMVYGSDGSQYTQSGNTIYYDKPDIYYDNYDDQNEDEDAYPYY